MTEFLTACGCFLGALVLGDGILVVLRPGDRGDLLGRLGWSAAAGSLSLALLLFLTGWLDLGLDGAGASFLVLLYLPFVLGILRLLRSERRRGPDPLPAPDVPTPLVLRLALCVALGFAVLSIVDASLVPALAGDEAMLWGYRARVIASEGGLGEAFVETMASPSLRHEDYPLFGSLLQAWVLGLVGDGDTVLLRLPLQLCALGLVAALASALRRHAGPWVAAALTLSFVALPGTIEALTSAGSEAPVALGLVLAADAWLRHRADGDDRWLALCAIGLALALFAKNDARLFVLALGAGLGATRLLTPAAARREVPRAAALWALVPATVVGLTLAYNRWAGFENDLVTGKGTGEGLLARLATQPLADATDTEGSYLAVTAHFFGDQLLTYPRYDGLAFSMALVALVLALPLAWRRRRAAGAEEAAPEDPEDPVDPSAPAHSGQPAAEAAGLCLAVAAGLAGLFLIYLATPQPLAWHLASSAPRVAWQLIPLALLAVAVAVAPRTTPWPDDVDSHRSNP